VYGLWLTVKGKALADSFVGQERDGSFWIASYQCEAAVIRARLESFIIADDVTVEDQTTLWAAVSVIGPAAEDLLRAPSAEGWIFRGRRAAGNADWIFPVERLEEIRARLRHLPELTSDDMVRWRIASGLPAVPTEIGPNDLPNEGGLDEAAISYTKGCYLGQEVMARLKSMGQVRRRLLRIWTADAVVPTVPAALFARGRNVGELRSAVGDGAGGTVGFAMLSLPNITADAELSLAGDNAPRFRLIDAP
jgi:folate-binding protein YgfZ